MRITCISDTHGLHDKISLRGGDLLIHAGDVSRLGRTKELIKFVNWFKAQPYRHKVFIAGNHDWGLVPERLEDKVARSIEEAKADNVHYLLDQSVDIEGFRIYGSPWQPEFFNWAFNLPRKGEDLAQKWRQIPNDTNILITHGPPHGVLDMTAGGDRVGCELLADRVLGKDMSSLKLHVFGHIHEGNGRMAKTRYFCNAAVCDLHYSPTNEIYNIRL